MLIDTILDALSDGKEHSLSEINTSMLRIGMLTGILGIVLKFLEEYGFITIFKGQDSALALKIAPPVQKFLRKIKEVEVVTRKREP